MSPEPNNIPARTVRPTSPNDNLEITPEPMEPETDEFKLLLIEYARSIIKSTIDHCSNESEALKNNIITAKRKVFFKYKIVETELSIAERKIKELKASNLKLRKAQAAFNSTIKADSTRIQDLEKQLRGRPEGKERGVNLLAKEIEKCEALEVELADLKKDKKRKRESGAAIWEDAEKVKLN
jgi:hypothetical protein